MRRYLKWNGITSEELRCQLFVKACTGNASDWLGSLDDNDTLTTEVDLWRLMLARYSRDLKTQILESTYLSSAPMNPCETMLIECSRRRTIYTKDRKNPS